MSETKWVYMIGDEHTSEYFATKQKAIDEGLRVYGEDEWHEGKTLSVGIFEPYQPFINAYGLIERWQDDVYDDYSECRGFDTYLDSVTEEQSKELEKELNEVLSKWIDKYGLEPNFGEAHTVEIIKK